MSVARVHRLERSQFVPRPRAETFAFFTDAGNLKSLTPASLRFEILSPLPVAMRPGAVIDYRIRLAGIPLRWRTVIEAFEPPRRFTDIQARGPYRRWHHAHEFFEVPGGTLVVDTVEYEMPLGPLGGLARALWVGRTLDGIFDHRRDALAGRLGGPASAGPVFDPAPAGAAGTL